MPTLAKKSRAQPGNIMIVDDNPANLKLLEDMLKQDGYDVRSFPRGPVSARSGSRGSSRLDAAGYQHARNGWLRGM